MNLADLKLKEQQHNQETGNEFYAIIGELYTMYTKPDNYANMRNYLADYDEEAKAYVADALLGRLRESGVNMDEIRALLIGIGLALDTNGVQTLTFKQVNRDISVEITGLFSLDELLDIHAQHLARVIGSSIDAEEQAYVVNQVFERVNLLLANQVSDKGAE